MWLMLLLVTLQNPLCDGTTYSVDVVVEGQGYWSRVDVVLHWTPALGTPQIEDFDGLSIGWPDDLDSLNQNLNDGDGFLVANTQGSHAGKICTLRFDVVGQIMGTPLYIRHVGGRYARTQIFAHNDLSGIDTKPFVVEGDANCDGTLNYTDVDAFVSVMMGDTEACCPIWNCDLNYDGYVDYRDVDLFIALLGANVL